MSVIKVWLRLEEQGDDEAIKLVFNDDNDISDVLVRIPTAVNVGALRPSELALHLPTETSSAPVSNRTPLLDLCDGSSRELTLVIRPKQVPVMPAAIAPVPQVQQPAVQSKLSRHVPSDSGGSASSSQARAKAAPAPMRRASSPNINAPSPSSSARLGSELHSRGGSTVALPPKPRPQSPSPYRRMPSVESSRTGLDARKPSPVVRRPSPVRSTTAAATTAPGAPSAVQLRESSSARRVAAVATASSTNRSIGGVASGVAQPPPANRKQKDEPTIVNQRVSAHRTTAHNNPAALAVQSTSVNCSSQAPVSNHISPATVCACFKPQWGNVLCATCKHSKQAHLIRQREQNLVNMADGASRGEGLKGRISQCVVGHVAAASSTRAAHLDPGAALPSTPDARQRIAVPDNGGEEAQASAEFSLLEPPVMTNPTGTFGSPAPSFSSRAEGGKPRR